MKKNSVEISFSPAVYHRYHKEEAIVLVTDVLRATSAICTAFMNGARKIIPVGTLGEAKKLKEEGHIVAAERDGIVRDFADFGNSPYNFTREMVEGKEIVYSTTNGTQAIQTASNSHAVIVGAFLNLSASAKWLIEQNRDVVILCAGWKDRFNLEDTIHAGAVAELLLKNDNFFTICDSTHAAIDLWNIAKNDLRGYIEKAAQRSRLKKNNLDDVIDYCLTPDMTEIIPVLENNYLILLNK